MMKEYELPIQHFIQIPFLGTLIKIIKILIFCYLSYVVLYLKTIIEFIHICPHISKSDFIIIYYLYYLCRIR